MKQTSELIIDESGIELLVDYEFQKEVAWIDEPALVNPAIVYTELKSVEVVIAHKGINILPLMNEKQKKHVIGLLTY